jgi:type IV pilus assembly protein PilY1
MKQNKKKIRTMHISFAVICLMQVFGALALTPTVKIATSPLLACTNKSNFNMQFPSAVAFDAFTNGAISATNYSDDGSYVYLSDFYPAKWGGSLKKYGVILDSNGLPRIAEMAIWDASDILTGVNQQTAFPMADNRKIYTSRIQSDNSLTTIEFKWNNLNSEQKSMLNMSPANGKKDGLGEGRLDYLRGTRSLEQGKSGGIFRVRERILGDVVSSNTVYVGPPVKSIQGADHHQFYETHKNRIKAVYVGANDGMLHAFDADNGRELFSYIPNGVFSALNQLSHPGYVHRPYVDGALSVSDAITSGGWKTILASSMGGGAQGVFALDVTNPSDFVSGAGVLWEFTDSDDSDMGNQMGTPVIAKFKVGTTNGISDYRYFVVVSSGLNNYKDDGTGKYDASGSGALFLLALDKSPSAKWERNVNYFKFKTPILHASNQNGLSTPALAIGNNGAVRYVYAGDLQGNLWRFDFNGAAPWSHARFGDVPVFTAKDSSGNPQPITTQPKIVFAPGGGYVMLFGTGKYLEESDVMPDSFKTQSFYGIYDTPQKSNGVAGRRQLESRTLVNRDDGFKIIGNEFAYGAGPSDKQGWYVDFPDSERTGERSVTNPVTVYGKLFFNTLVPDATRCDKGAGRSYSMDALTGLSAGEDTTGHVSDAGLLSSPVVFQARVQQSGQRPDGKEKSKKQFFIFNFGKAGTKEIAGQSRQAISRPYSIEVPAMRLGWREVPNWQELRDAASKK